MSVVVTVQSGFDLDYFSSRVTAEPERSPGGYYINASTRGEATGRWFGPGCATLGLTGTVAAEQFRQVYSLISPLTGQRLGGPRRDFSRGYQARLAQLLDAEPHATADRIHELEQHARRDTRQSPAYTDVTLSFCKSVSLLHGSVRENAARARDAGDHAAAAWWDGRDARFCEILQEANAAAMAHLQTWAGVTRTGYHGRKVDGRELGRWEPADLVGTSWLQGTSRDGDMHDHIHNPVLPRVRTLSDGKWRATDTMAIRRQIPAIQATAAAYAETVLSREFGVAWTPRADGTGHEIRAVTQKEIDAFSSRRDSVTARQAELAAQFRARYGRAPSQRELLTIHRTAWAATRASKPGGLIDFDEAARAWGAEWERMFGTPLAGLASRVSNLTGPQARGPHQSAHRQRSPDGRVLAAAARIALARVQARHATWTRADLMREVKAALAPEHLGTDPAAAVTLVGALADRALAGEFEPVQCLEAPEAVPLPNSLRRPLDGRSVYTRPGSVRYATRVQLALEERLVADAQHQTEARLTPEQATAQTSDFTRDTRQAGNEASSRGSLGSGNHFIEISLDEDDRVWLFLHSGSRGVGNKLATRHIKVAREQCRKRWISLPDPDLAYLVEGDSEFWEYLRDLRWAQHFALLNRQEMMHRVLQSVQDWRDEETGCLDAIECHHNYTVQETHFGKKVWLSRKGAIDASAGMAGLIPGSMGTRSYVVTGKGSRLALNSSPHGAGREYSRSAARRRFSRAELDAAMDGIEWRRTDAFLDEIPAAYKNIDVVMRDAADVVEVRHTLRQIVNVKGD